MSRFWVIAAVVNQPLPAEARCERLRRLRDYLAADAAVPPGGIIRNMKVVTFSLGLNGPGVWLLTGVKLWRKAAIAMASSAVRCAKACQGMIGARMRPSGRSRPVSPSRSALGSNHRCRSFCRA